MNRSVVEGRGEVFRSDVRQRTIAVSSAAKIDWVGFSL